MYSHLRRCESDEDYAQFTLFFLRHRADFNPTFTLADALHHIVGTIDSTHILLVINTQNQVMGWSYYRFIDADGNPDAEGETVFVDSIIIAEELRRSRTFYQGFRDMVQQVARENSHVQSMQFHAETDNAYLNRLYSKFASVIDQTEGFFSSENIYAADFNELYRYFWGNTKIDSSTAKNVTRITE